MLSEAALKRPLEVLILALSSALASCGDDDTTTPPVTDPPRIVSISAVPWAIVSGSTTIAVGTERADSVALFVDGRWRDSDVESPFSLTWQTGVVTNGLHLLNFRAGNSYGHADSTIVTLVENAGAGVGVAVAPLVVTLTGNQTQQFTAFVLDTTDERVAWSVQALGQGIDDPGSIDQNGLYHAPATVPLTATVIVTARSQANTTKTGTATVTLR